MGIDERLAAAWREAASDLNIRVFAPHNVPIIGSGAILCEAFLPDFGSPRGAVALSKKSERKARPLLRSSAKVWFSVLSDRSYAKYKRSLYVDTLNDWGWFGEPSPPAWFTGTAWS